MTSRRPLPLLAGILLVLVCAGLVWMPPSTFRARLFGQSGTVVVTVCNPAGGGAQRIQWTCAGDFTPDGDGPVRQVSFRSSSELPAGSHVEADATSGTASEVQARTGGLTAVLLCPLFIIAVVAVGAFRAWSTRKS
ncbi:hypothetical protein [Actinoplanes siamensis]|uniref:Uncharacterized protein n=1 Tax=Actinoplanes siamensis TaxID=1223317 RepID=A0A919TPF6_9ACTN|nr:hypothetical protein [Actinoplanes siamensis]GIF09727.1 hypothetical protein Asi03nite_72650 [Actinoplanes siamensis]